jgi:uncharacterized membrane protein YbhN (UPF0104 family)
MLAQSSSSFPGRRRPPTGLLICGIAVTASVVLAGLVATVPSLIAVPARLIGGCGAWIALAGVFELLSALSFVVVFTLVFGAEMTWRRSGSAGLRALGASVILPAGGLAGPAAAAWTAGTGRASPRCLSCSVIAFVVLNNAPGLIVLAGLGTASWLGWTSGPRDIALTLLPAVLAAGVLTAGWRVRCSRARASAAPQGGRRALPSWGVSASLLRDGVAETRGLVLTRDWKLLGAVGTYAFDNAILWAAFRAYGATPALSVLILGYLIGSLASAFPSPGGVGAVDGGLIGALVLYGAPAAASVFAVLLYRSITLGVPLVLGGAAWLPDSGARLRSRVATRWSTRATRTPRPPELSEAPVD